MLNNMMFVILDVRYIDIRYNEMTTRYNKRPTESIIFQQFFFISVGHLFFLALKNYLFWVNKVFWW